MKLKQAARIIGSLGGRPSKVHEYVIGPVAEKPHIHRIHHSKLTVQRGGGAVLTYILDEFDFIIYDENDDGLQE
jgi:hypothetical protein